MDDDVLEEYLFGRLSEEEVETIETHLMVCETCQDELTSVDSYRVAICDAAPRFAHQNEPVRRPWFALFPSYPRMAWALGLIAAALCIGLGMQAARWRRMSATPAAITLQAMRGDATDAAIAHAGKPLILNLDLAGLEPAERYQVEVVDATGKPQYRCDVSGQSRRVQIEQGLPAGTLFARLYSPSHDLLREYSLKVTD